MAGKRAEQASPAPESPIELAKSAFGAALEAIRDEIHALKKGKEELAEVADGKVGIGGRDPTDRIAKLAGQVANIAGELRKLDKAEGYALRDLTREQVLVWARQQTPELRARLRRELEAIDSRNRRSVLG